MTYDDALRILIHDVVHPLSKHLKREDSNLTCFFRDGPPNVLLWNNGRFLCWLMSKGSSYIYIYIDVSMYNIPTITLTQHVRFNPLKIQLQAAGKRVIRHTLTHVLQEIHDDTYDRVTILPYEWQTVGIIWNYMVSNHTNTISSAIVLDFCWHKIHIATPTLFSHISVRLLLQWSWWIQPRILIHSLSNQNKHNIISPFLVSHCLRWFGDSPSNTTSS